MNLNSVQLAGRLTRDPEIRYTSSGVAIADIGIAVTRFSKDDQGQTKESTDFIDCTAFGKTAETIQKHLHKGSPIYAEGRLKLEQWQDKTTNQARSKLKVILDSMQFIGPRQAEPASNQSQRQATAPRSRANDLDGMPEPDDIPF
jgi:single-strand DNA-binding protein